MKKEAVKWTMNETIISCPPSVCESNMKTYSVFTWLPIVITWGGTFFDGLFHLLLIREVGKKEHDEKENDGNGSIRITIVFPHKWWQHGQSSPANVEWLWTEESVCNGAIPFKRHEKKKEKGHFFKVLKNINIAVQLCIVTIERKMWEGRLPNRSVSWPPITTSIIYNPGVLDYGRRYRNPEQEKE